MDEKIQILLNSKKNINSVDKNTFGRIELTGSKNNFNELNITKIASASDVFYQEREENENYRVYGRIEYFSLLNGIKSTYNNVDDLFYKVDTNVQNIYNSFDFYLVKPSTTFTRIGTTNRYIRKMEVISTPSNFDIFNAGFTNNLFGDDVYSFVVNNDIDISGYLDGLGMPLTDIYLYPRYLANINVSEMIKEITWDTNGVGQNQPLTSTKLNLGDLVNGDIVEFDKEEYQQTIYSSQQYNIETKFTAEPVTTIYWNYNPFIPIKLRYFSSNLNKANKLTTSHDQLERIPKYAIKVNDLEENYIWRNILPQGSYDPITNEGVNYPFINKKRYVFITPIVDIIPDMLNSRTFDILKYGNPSISNLSPTTDVNNIGKPCQ